MGIDEESRQHTVAMAHRLHEFSHRTEERELELWHWLSRAMDLPGVEHLMTRTQNEMETEYNSFIQWLSNFMNQEISQFEYKLMLLEGTSQKIQNTDT